MPISLKDAVTKRADKAQMLTPGDDAANSIWIMTTADTDRDGEVVVPEGLDFSDFDKNPVFIDNHQTDGGVSDVILGRVVRHWLDEVGEGTKWPQPGGPARSAQMAEIEWNVATERGREARDMAKTGMLNGGSISFLPKGRADKNDQGGNKYNEALLLEFTACAVGSNPSAIRVKSAHKNKQVTERPMPKAKALRSWVEDVGAGTRHDVGGPRRKARLVDVEFPDQASYEAAKRGTMSLSLVPKAMVGEAFTDWRLAGLTIQIPKTRSTVVNKGIFDGETLSVVSGPYAGMLATVKQDQGAKLLVDIYDPDNSNRPPVTGVTLDRANTRGSQWRSLKAVKAGDLKAGDKVEALRPTTGQFEPATVVSCSARSATIQYDKDGVTVDMELDSINRKKGKSMKRKRWINKAKKSLWVLKSEGDPAVDPVAEQEIKDYIEERGLDDVKVEEEAPTPEDGYVEEKQDGNEVPPPLYPKAAPSAGANPKWTVAGKGERMSMLQAVGCSEDDARRLADRVWADLPPETQAKLGGDKSKEAPAQTEVATVGANSNAPQAKTLEVVNRSGKWFVFDGGRIVAGPFDSQRQAQDAVDGGVKAKADDLADDVAKRAKELSDAGATEGDDAVDAAMAEVDVPVEMRKAVKAIAKKRINKKFYRGDKVEVIKPGDPRMHRIGVVETEYNGNVQVKFPDGQVEDYIENELDKSLSKETDLSTPDKISETEINAAMKDGPDGSDFDPTEMRLKDAMSDCVSAKIAKLVGEGKDQDQAAAIAYSMCGEKAMKHGVKKSLLLKVAKAVKAKVCKKKINKSDFSDAVEDIKGLRAEGSWSESQIKDHIRSTYSLDEEEYRRAEQTAGHPAKSLKSIKTAKTDEEAQTMAKEKVGVMRGTTVRLLNGLQGTVAGIGYGGITVRDARGQVHTGLDFDDFTTAGIPSGRGGFDLGRYMSMGKRLKTPALKKKELDNVSAAADKLAKAAEDEEKRLKDISEDPQPSAIEDLQKRFSKGLSEDQQPVAIEDLQKSLAKRVKRLKRASKRIKAIAKRVKKHRKALSEEVTGEQTWSGVNGKPATWDGTPHTGAAETWPNQDANPDMNVSLGKAIKMAKAAGKSVPRKKLKRKEVDAIMRAADLLEEGAKAKAEGAEGGSPDDATRALSEKLRKIARKRGKHKAADDIEEMKRLKALAEDQQPSAIEDLQKRKDAEDAQKKAEDDEAAELYKSLADGTKRLREKAAGIGDLIYQNTGLGRN